jgi:hypothetical protein
MATVNNTGLTVLSKFKVPPRPRYSDSDHTADRLLAFRASMRPIDSAFDDDSYRNGYFLIERLAASAKGTDLPRLQLTAKQAADVLRFITLSEPVEHKDWWLDPKHAPSHVVGFGFALQAVECCLRAIGARS